MMLPALMSSPPYDFTPRRFDSESRPFRELPPAFLCAIGCSPSAEDALDLELGVILPMALMLLVVLAPAHLENRDLLATPVANDSCLNSGAGDDRLTDPDAVALADHQHLVEDDLRADVCDELLDP